MILGREEIKKLADNYQIIHPFDLQLLDGDSYVLTVKEEVTITYLSHRNLVSYETVFIPPQYIGRLSMKAKYGRGGLFFAGAAIIHSGWVGRLTLEVLNVGDDRKPIMIRNRDPFVHLLIEERKGKPFPYMGGHQFQLMTQEEKEMLKPFMEKAWEDAGLDLREYLKHLEGR